MLFQYFSDTFDYLIEKDKKEGRYDMGILGREGRGAQTPPAGCRSNPNFPCLLPLWPIALHNVRLPPPATVSCEWPISVQHSYTHVQLMLLLAALLTL